MIKSQGPFGTLDFWLGFSEIQYSIPRKSNAWDKTSSYGGNSNHSKSNYSELLTKEDFYHLNISTFEKSQKHPKHEISVRTFSEISGNSNKKKKKKKISGVRNHTS